MTIPPEQATTNAAAAMRALAAAVESRGYRAGWAPDQYLARQLIKLGEEYAEAAWNMRLEPGQDLDFTIRDMGLACRFRFLTPQLHQPAELMTSADTLIEELADMQIVIACAIGALEELTGQPIDLLDRALRKATEDIQRGVRTNAGR